MEEEKTPQKSPETQKKPLLPKYQWSWKFFFNSFVWLGLLMFIVDLITKWVAVKSLGLDSYTTTAESNNGAITTHGSAVTLIPNFLYLICTINPGSAYSFGANLPWMRYVFIVISWVATFAILYYWYTQLGKHDNLINSVFALCFAGAIGNGIDRTFYWPGTTGFSGVVDWIQFYLFPGANGWFPFPTFNIADACLTVGVAIAIVTLIVRAIKESRPAK
jgi:signal peptidase II